jgi:hypothetical protein
LHVTASCTSLSRTQLSPDRARISYSFGWICDTLRQIWEMRWQIWEMRDERQRAWRRRQIWEIKSRFERQRWEADLRDERQGEVATEKVRRWDKFRVRKYADLRDERQGEVAAEKVWRWDKFRVRKYVIYTPFFFKR